MMESSYVVSLVVRIVLYGVIAIGMCVWLLLAVPVFPYLGMTGSGIAGVAIGCLFACVAIMLAFVVTSLEE